MTNKYCQYDVFGFSRGEAETPGGFVPNLAFAEFPPETAEDGSPLPAWKRYRRTGPGAFELADDNRGREGYLADGTWLRVKTPALPENWYGDERPEPPVNRALEIHNRLSKLDYLSIRALRATAAGEATDEDRRLLAEYEAEAQALRAELETLEAANEQ